jgi:Fur family ferric uptake transcriptional regulator
MTSVRREKAAGVRPTRQRASIVEALRGAAGFKTAQELHLDMMREGERVGLATVYRNLQALADAGEVDVLYTDLGETMFRLCEGAEHHHHLVCRGCGRSVEVKAEEVETWAARVAKRHGFEQMTHTVEIFGLCEQCSA